MTVSAVSDRDLAETARVPRRVIELRRGGRALGGSYLYEPDEDQLLEALLPKHVQTQVYRILLESFAAFYGAQMAAMDGATRNAGELIKKVTLYYNKTRQAAITKELMDIVGGAEALK